MHPDGMETVPLWEKIVLAIVLVPLAFGALVMFNGRWR